MPAATATAAATASDLNVMGWSDLTYQALLASKLSGFQAFGLSGFRAFRLSGFPAFRLSSFRAFELCRR